MGEGLHYRADIDGLRAVAVLIVVLFHAQLGIFSGGYTGVDVFFVISGFLITSILKDDLQNQSFSIAKFYERRIRRIFPALFTVILASAIAGWFTLTPADYKSFAISASATAAFISNISFNRRAGYFAPAATTQPLLHTWSLGVEEQYYVIAPLLIYALYRWGWKYRGAVVVTIAALSLGTAAYGVRHEWTSAFYLLPSRAWELAIGALLALAVIPDLASRVLRDGLGLIGLAMILAAALVYSPATPFPGFAALLPCVGAALVIYSGRSTSDTIAARLLAMPPVVFVGKISYSLYLWHWPLLAFAEYEWPGELDVRHRLMLVALAFALSIVTYVFIEQPARRKSPFLTRQRVYAFGLAAMAACIAGSYAIRLSDGVMARLPEEARAFLKQNPTKGRSKGLCAKETVVDASASIHDCLIGDAVAVPPSFLFWGDSHALAVAPEFSSAAKVEHRSGYFVGTGGCPPLLGLDQLDAQTFGKCVRGAATLPALLVRPDITTVALFNRWALYAEGSASPNETAVNVRHFVDADPDANRAKFVELLRATIRSITSSGRDVVIFGPVPELPFHLQSAIIRAMMRHRTQDFSLPAPQFFERQKHVLALLRDLEKEPRVRVFYPHEKLCGPVVCETLDKGQPLYVDDDHLSPLGARRLIPMFREALSVPLPKASSAQRN